MKIQKLNCVQKLIVAFWLTAAAAILGRIAFDVKTYFFGSTLVFQGIFASGYDYALHLPKNIFMCNKYPVILFLHGAGETGKSATENSKNDIMRYVNESATINEFPFIVISPVTEKHGWNPVRLERLLDDAFDADFGRFKPDLSRIYVTGLSMGGFGTFNVACKYPERFAAIVPICGGGDVTKAARLKSVPNWIFHGDADDVVSWKCSSEMSEAMEQSGCEELIFTTIPGGGHGIWRDVYANPELYHWLLKHKK